MNKTTLRMIIVLAVIGVLSGGFLASVYRVAKPLIEDSQERELREAIFVVLPKAKKYRVIEKEEGVIVYKGLDAEGNPAGVAYEAQGPGYQSNIRIMVGINDKLNRLLGIKVLQQLETPGLGARIAEEEFEKQFRGVVIKPEIEWVKGREREKENQVQAITGATISSKSVVKTINERTQEVLRAIKGK